MKKGLGLILNFSFRFKHFRLLTRLTPVFFIAIIGMSFFFQSEQSLSSSPLGWNYLSQAIPAKYRASNIHSISRGNFVMLTFEGRGRNKNLYVVPSFDGGRSFLEPIFVSSFKQDRVTAVQMQDHHPQLAIDSQKKCVLVWQDLNPQNSNCSVYFSESFDLGASWTKPTRISDEQNIAMLPQAIYDQNDKLHIFYQVISSSKFFLLQTEPKIDKNNSLYWSKKFVTELNSKQRGVFIPSIYQKEGKFFVVFQDKLVDKSGFKDNIYFLTSKNNGKSWSSAKILNPLSESAFAPSLAMANNGKTMATVFQTKKMGIWELKLALSYDQGKNWRFINCDFQQNEGSYNSSIVFDQNNNLYLVWQSGIGRNAKIFASTYNILENSFSAIQQISGKESATKACLQKQDGEIAVYWQENSQILARISDHQVKVPEVYSTTHPLNSWQKSTEATVSWKAPADSSGIVGYATFVNDDPDFIPAVQNVNETISKMKISDLKDGVNYFHISAIDGVGNFSRPIHYKMLVSHSRLPMPTISSLTHPEGKISKSRNFLVDWKMTDSLRVRGYVYSLHKDTVIAPNKFTYDNNLNFEKLTDGRYFLCVMAIDKTNTVGFPAIYEIIVNKAPLLNPKYYDQIARMNLIPDKTVYSGIPKLSISLVDSVLYAQTPFRLKFKLRDLDGYSAHGYSVYLAKEAKPADKYVDYHYSRGRVKVENSGGYYLTAKAKFGYLYQGKKVYAWTKPVQIKINVKPAIFLPEPEGLYKEWKKLFLKKQSIIVPVLLLAFLIFIYLLNGKRMRFRWGRYRYKVKNYFGVKFKKELA